MATFSYKDFKHEYKLFNMHKHADRWGEALSAMFSICNEVHYRMVHGDNPKPLADILAKWEYRASPIAYDDPREEEDNFYNEFKEMEINDLIRCGELMDRYLRLLKRHGLDY